MGGVRARVYLMTGGGSTNASTRSESFRGPTRSVAVGAGLDAANGSSMASVSKPGRQKAVALPRPRVLGVGKLANTLPSGRALALGFGLLAAGLLAYLGARETSLFAVRSIRISGAPPRVATHVRGALAPLEGRSLVGLDRNAIEHRLSSLPDVAAATVDRDFPHTLRVAVIPAHSIAVLRRGPSAWIVSSDGRVIRTAGRLASPRLPRIWVQRAATVDEGATVGDTDAARAIAALATARHAHFIARIATVRASDHELTFVLLSGLELRFGDTGDLPLKLAVAKRLVPFVQGAGGYVDVAVPERPVAGLNPQVSTSG
jgi:cell division septal protein FtsQ